MFKIKPTDEKINNKKNPVKRKKEILNEISDILMFFIRVFHKKREASSVTVFEGFSSLL